MPLWRSVLLKYIEVLHQLYPLKVNALKERLSQNNNLSDPQKVKVAFLVTHDSKFAAKPLFEKMIKDDLFDPIIVTIPVVRWWRGGEKFYQLNKVYTKLVDLYGSNYVLNSYCEESNTCIDVSSGIDIAVFEVPYKGEVEEQYTIQYYAKKQILPIYINYGMMPDSCWSIKYIMCSEALSLCWKVFLETKDNFDDYCKHTLLREKNAVLSGYCKMDHLALIERKKLDRKKIILAPHHSIETSWMPISNFLTYSDFFLELPQKYPQIDFVFRPHPVLFSKLVSVWGKEKVDDYIKKISSFSNVEYQEGGDYLETFVNSDAIIHDCASFMMEYLYTGHPAMYLLKNKEVIEEIFASIGQKCLEHYYQAFNEQDIINFIEEVVLKDNDPLKEERIKFAKEEIMINYPHVADFILQHIKDELTT